MTTEETVAMIAPVPGEPELRIVRTAGRDLATVRARDLEQLGLVEGTALDASTLEHLALLHRRTSAWLKAVRMLGPSALPRSRIAARLTRAGFDASDVDAVLDDLEHAGLLDDAGAARAMIESQLARAPEAPGRLSRRLIDLGIEESLAASVVREVLADRNPDEDLALAATAALRGLADLPRQAAIRRFAGRMTRRGYDEEAIAGLIERTWPS